MKKNDIIKKTIVLVRKELLGETTGHDWWHTWQVWQHARRIGREEHVDMFIVQMAALVHDLDDWKVTGGDESASQKKIARFLGQLGILTAEKEHILMIVRDLSYKSPTGRSVMTTKEGMVVQDADRLEALGAIGIARTFATGQKLGQELYNPTIKPNLVQGRAEYKKQYTGEKKNTTINHFYEKLLRLETQMNTPTAKRIAKKRTLFMKTYLKEFIAEWHGRA
jgi:uncharacterized protein